MIVFLSMSCCILVIFLGISLMYNIRHARILIALEDALVESLDVCDTAYNKITGILEMPVALNTPEVRQVVDQIKATRDSVLYVSNIIAAPYGGITEEDSNDAV